jgi:glyoxylase I family protein
VNIRAIHHIAILTDDYEQSKRFYTEVLGFEIIRETYRAERQSYKLDLAIAGHYQIELFSFPEFRERGSYPESKGLRHMAFAVDSVEDVFYRSQRPTAGTL